MRIFFILLFFLPAYSAASECVVLLHGLARTKNSMVPIAKNLSKEGYKVVNHGYASRQGTIEKLAKSAVPKAIKKCGQVNKIHFVTHSLGGILVRYYLSKFKLNKLGRVVMLGPPNKGSHVVDKMRSFPGFAFMNGPAGLQLGTAKSSIVNTIGSPYYDVGIIAGSKSINLILSTYLPNPDDGKVSVENTKLAVMTDHITLPVSHTFMMRNKTVIKQVMYFLKNGMFSMSSDDYQSK